MSSVLLYQEGSFFSSTLPHTSKVFRSSFSSTKKGMESSSSLKGEQHASVSLLCSTMEGKGIGTEEACSALPGNMPAAPLPSPPLPITSGEENLSKASCFPQRTSSSSTRESTTDRASWGLCTRSTDTFVLPPLLSDPVSRHQAFFKTSDPVTHSAVIAHDTHSVEPIVATRLDTEERVYLQTEAMILYQEKQNIKAQQVIMAAEKKERHDMEIEGMILLDALVGWQREIKENLFGKKTADRALARFMEKLQNRMNFQLSLERDGEEELKKEGRLAWQKAVMEQRAIDLAEKEKARLQQQKTNMERRAIVFVISEEQRQRQHLESTLTTERESFFNELVAAYAEEEEAIASSLVRRAEEKAARIAKEQKEAKRLKIELAKDERLFAAAQRLLVDACRHGPTKASVFSGTKPKTECLQCRVRYDEEWNCYVHIDHPEPPPSIRVKLRQQKSLASQNASGNASVLLSSTANTSSKSNGRGGGVKKGNGQGRVANTTTGTRGGPLRSSASAIPAVGTDGSTIPQRKRNPSDASTQQATPHQGDPAELVDFKSDPQTAEALMKRRKAGRIPEPSPLHQDHSDPSSLPCNTGNVDHELPTTKGGTERGDGVGVKGKGSRVVRTIPETTMSKKGAIPRGTPAACGRSSSVTAGSPAIRRSLVDPENRSTKTTAMDAATTHASTPTTAMTTNKSFEEEKEEVPDEERRISAQDGMRVISIPPASSVTFSSKPSEARVAHLKALSLRSKRNRCHTIRTCPSPFLLPPVSVDAREDGGVPAEVRCASFRVSGRGERGGGGPTGVTLPAAVPTTAMGGKAGRGAEELPKRHPSIKRVPGLTTPTNATSSTPSVTEKTFTGETVRCIPCSPAGLSSAIILPGRGKTSLEEHQEGVPLTPGNTSLLVDPAVVQGTASSMMTSVKLAPPFLMTPATTAVNPSDHVQLEGDLYPSQEGKKSTTSGIIMSPPTTHEGSPSSAEPNTACTEGNGVMSVLVRSSPSAFTARHKDGGTRIGGNIRASGRPLQKGGRNEAGVNSGTGASRPKVSLIVESDEERLREGVAGPSRVSPPSRPSHGEKAHVPLLVRPSLATEGGEKHENRRKTQEEGKRNLHCEEGVIPRTWEKDAAVKSVVGGENKEGLGRVNSINLGSEVAFSSPIPTSSGGHF